MSEHLTALFNTETPKLEVATTKLIELRKILRATRDEINAKSKEYQDMYKQAMAVSDYIKKDKAVSAILEQSQVVPGDSVSVAVGSGSGTGAADADADADADAAAVEDTLSRMSSAGVPDISQISRYVESTSVDI